LSVTCPACQHEVDPAPLQRGSKGYFGEARFCPTPINALERCGTDLVNHAGLVPPRVPKPEPLERDIQRAVIRYLELQPHVLVLRQSVGLAEHNGRRVLHGVPGQADLTVAIGPDPAVVEFWEIKRPGEKQRPLQLKFEERCRRIGAAYRLIHSIEEARAALVEAKQRRAG
jgi:hypothetical protein